MLASRLSRGGFLLITPTCLHKCSVCVEAVRVCSQPRGERTLLMTRITIVIVAVIAAAAAAAAITAATLIGPIAAVGAAAAAAVVVVTPPTEIGQIKAVPTMVVAHD